MSATKGGVICRAACILLASLLSACSSSDARSPRPTPTSPTAPTLPDPPIPPASSGRLQMSGRVLDQNGTPVPGALVEVDYSPAGGVSNPPSFCPSSDFCWLATRSNDRGEYSVEFDPQSGWRGRLGAVNWGLGFVYSFREGYEVDVQWVPTGSTPAVRDMRLRTTRAIPAGESILVSVEATSSLCTDLEDLWVMDSRCEIVVIESGAGMLNVVARPAAGGPAPSIFWYTTGNYAGLITRPAPGAVAIPVRGGRYRVLVAIPEGAPSQQFNVTTTLR
jgi:hypothetical protein